MPEKTMTLEEFYNKCNAGERDFTGIQLLNLELIRLKGIPTGIILKKAYLNGANLEETGIVDVDLSYAKLRKTRLGETGFIRTNLEGADFQSAHFCETCFYNCNLRCANFSGTAVRAILFSNVDLSHANFSDVNDFGTLLFNRVIFHETIMPDGSLCSDNPRDNCNCPEY